MSQQPAPAEQLFQMCLGFIPAICLNIVAHLSLADQLASGPKDIDEIARASNVNSDALYRVMRAVSSVGVFHEVEHRRFGQTPASDLLRQDHSQSGTLVERLCFWNLPSVRATSRNSASGPMSKGFWSYADLVERAV